MVDWILTLFVVDHDEIIDLKYIIVIIIDL